MKEKLVIANNLRVSRNMYGNNLEYQKLCLKCYHAYLIECIIKGKDNFNISFRSKYIQSFSERMSDYYRYIIDYIYRLFLIYFTPKDDTTSKKYELIHVGVSKPHHLKNLYKPNEIFLSSFLEKNGLHITNERVYYESIVYDIVRL